MKVKVCWWIRKSRESAAHGRVRPILPTVPQMQCEGSWHFLCRNGIGVISQRRGEKKNFLKGVKAARWVYTSQSKVLLILKATHLYRILSSTTRQLRILRVSTSAHNDNRGHPHQLPGKNQLDYLREKEERRGRRRRRRERRSQTQQHNPGLLWEWWKPCHFTHHHCSPGSVIGGSMGWDSTSGMPVLDMAS